MNPWDQLSEQDTLGLVDDQLHENGSSPQKVLIVSAGMAGLAAADALLRAGHDPLIVEAQGRGVRQASCA